MSPTLSKILTVDIINLGLSYFIWYSILCEKPPKATCAVIKYLILHSLSCTTDSMYTVCVSLHSLGRLLFPKLIKSHFPISTSEVCISHSAHQTRCLSSMLSLRYIPRYPVVVWVYACLVNCFVYYRISQQFSQHLYEILRCYFLK